MSAVPRFKQRRRLIGMLGGCFLKGLDRLVRVASLHEGETEAIERIESRGIEGDRALERHDRIVDIATLAQRDAKIGVGDARVGLSFVAVRNSPIAASS